MRPIAFLLLFATVALAEGPPRVDTAGPSESDLPDVVETSLGGSAIQLAGWGAGERRPREEQVRRGDIALGALASSPKACALRTLVISGMPFGAQGLAALHTPCLANLETLHLYVEGFGDDGARAIADAPFARRLTSLRVDSTMGPDGIAALVGAMPALEELEVTSPSVGAAGADAIAAAPLPHLQRLALGCAKVEGRTREPLGDAGVAALGRSTTLPALVELRLCGESLTAAGARALVEGGLAGRLRVLAIGGADREAASILGGAAPALKPPQGLTDATRSAWSSARAAALLHGGIVAADVYVADQADLARLEGASEIHGSLSISGGVTDLAPLRALTRVTGRLQIQKTSALQSLEALAGLREVGGDLQISSNRALRTTAGLRGLTVVGGNLDIPVVVWGNPRLAEISFPALERVGGLLDVSREPGKFSKESCWCPDQPPGVSEVAAVRVRPFPRLVEVGGWEGRRASDRGLAAEEPALFPALPPAAP